MTLPSSRSAPILTTPQGFVLVAVLLLIALVTVLVVTTSLLARIERNAVDNSARTEIARQNALFGLDVALAQLQKDVGPDQSVTARADILDANLSATSAPAVVGVKNPYWTGAWKAYNPAASSQNLDVDSTGAASSALLRGWSTAPINGRPNPANPNMEWLISGAAADHANAAANSTSLQLIPTTWSPVLTSANPATPRNAVVLAKNLPDLSRAQPTTATVSVCAPLVGMRAAGAATPTVIGQYAYWVSDEGVKAKANLLDATLSASNPNYTKNQTHFLTSQANLMNNVLPVVSGKDLRTDPAVPKVSTLQSLGLLSSLDGSSLVGSGAAQFAPDVTTYSMGVLADVRNGGLKRDLTAAFEDDASVNASGQFTALLASCGTVSGQDAQAVYRANNAALAVPVQSPTPNPGSLLIDGLLWESLYKYYNLYKTTLPLWRAPKGSGTAPTGVASSNLGFTAAPAAPYALQQHMHSYVDVGTRKIPMDPIAPVMLQARVDVAITSFQDPTTHNYRLRLRYYPMLVLYNPYGVKITSAQGTAYNFYTNYLSLNSARWKCIIKVNNVGVPPFDGVAPNDTGYGLTQGSNYPLSLTASTTDTASFDPGEIKVFALTADVPRSTLGDPSTTNVCNLQSLTSSSVNISADYAQTYDIPWTGTANASDAVTVSVNSANFYANVAYLSSSTLDGWPDGTQTSSGNGTVQSLNLPNHTPSGTWPSGGIAISSLNGTPYLLEGFNVRSKGIKVTSDTNYVNAGASCVPPVFAGNSLAFSDVDEGNWREVYTRDFRPYSQVTEVQMDNPAMNGQPHHTSWGNNSVGNGPVTNLNSRIPLRDVPCQPMISLGQYSHMAEMYYAGSGSWQALFFTGRSIGGSFACSDFALNYNAGTNVGGNLSANQIAFDNSFMANQVLFDSYYFSTVPAAAQPVADASKYVMTSSQLDSAVQNNQPLPNNRMQFYYKNGSYSNLSTYKANLRDLRKAATCLMVNGAFNVNSTSVNAWKSLLSSLTGNSLKVWNYTNNSAYTYASANLVNPIPRFWNSTGLGSVDQPWDGMRTLTADTSATMPGGLTALATHIVQQVKMRGPFLSMGDFLNRRLGSAKTPLNEMGALQEAIEECAVPNNSGKNINDAAINEGQTTILPNATSSNVPTAFAATNFYPQNSATGIPGYLMQQDLVQAFAPVMSARSDTFVVRCYGEADNARVRNADGTAKADARAWCEAVVQRLPEYVDQTDTALTGSTVYGTNLGDATPVFDRITSPASPTPIVNATNRTFGRRLKVVSFRWLNESDL